MGYITGMEFVSLLWGEILSIVLPIHKICVEVNNCHVSRGSLLVWGTI